MLAAGGWVVGLFLFLPFFALARHGWRRREAAGRTGRMAWTRRMLVAGHLHRHRRRRHGRVDRGLAHGYLDGARNVFGWHSATGALSA